AIDVLVVHHLPLGLADALQDHLLRRLRGDAAEALWRHLGPRDLFLGDVGEVDLEVVVGDERVLALARLLLEALELFELALARVVEQAHLEVARQLDRVDVRVPLVVHLDDRMTRRTRRLLVGGEKRVLDGRDERPLLDALVTLELANRFDDLLAHWSTSRRSSCPARLRRTESRWCRRRRSGRACRHVRPATLL